MVRCCGAGLYTVPQPGDISVEKICALLMDMTSLSLRLKKPLTARLMPLPGAKSGNMTEFDFAFFENGKILDFPADTLTNALARSK